MSYYTTLRPEPVHILCHVSSRSPLSSRSRNPSLSTLQRVIPMEVVRYVTPTYWPNRLQQLGSVWLPEDAGYTSQIWVRTYAFSFCKGYVPKKYSTKVKTTIISRRVITRIMPKTWHNWSNKSISCISKITLLMIHTSLLLMSWWCFMPFAPFDESLHFQVPPSSYT